MITAELFSDTAAEQQALEIHELAIAEREWLQEARTGTFKGYNTERVAIESLRRVVRARTLNGYLLRQDRKVIGVGTIVSNLTIKHPVPKCPGQLRLSGDQIDYWTKEIEYEDHRAVALTLVEATRTPTVLGILSEPEMERAAGIVDMMEPVGEPGRIRVPMGKGNYGLNVDETPLQVFTYQRDTPDA